jgi:hypothetical protein
LITDGRELRVARRLAGHADSLTHLAVDGRLGAVLVTAVLVSGALPLLVGLALGFLFLLLCLPFFANFLKLWPKVSIVVIRRCWWMTRLEGKGQL